MLDDDAPTVDCQDMVEREASARFCLNLRLAMNLLGVSQADLAARSGLSTSRVSLLVGISRFTIPSVRETAVSYRRKQDEGVPLDRAEALARCVGLPLAILVDDGSHWAVMDKIWPEHRTLLQQMIALKSANGDLPTL